MRKHVELKTIILYLLLFLLTIITFQQIWFKGLFDAVNFLNWDAGHYHFIMSNGYEGHRVAFFPLFPLIWRYLSLNEYGAVILNTVIFLISFYVLIKELKIKSIEEVALYLSIPSFIFFYLPYSESLFFLTSILILVGLKKQKNILVYIGLFLAILSRPAFSIFVPALLITELLSKKDSKVYLRVSLYILITLLGILIVGIIQYVDTSDWFMFFEAQKNWENELQIPKLPLRSWGTGFAFRMDSFAFLIGVISGVIILSLILKLKWVKNIILSRDVIFALSYLGGITLLVLLFRGGSLFSLNRFVFATPFIIVAFNYWFNQNIELSHTKLLSIFGFICVFWLLFGSYSDILELSKFTALTFYVILLFSIKSKKEIIRKYSLLLLIFLNFSFQVICYLGFLNVKWIG